MLATPPVRFCNDEFAYDADASAGPATLAPLRDSGGIAGDAEALRERLATDGYLWVRGLLDREEVLTARHAILGYMDEHEGLEPGARPLDGVMGRYGKPVKLENRREVTESEPVRRVLESPRLFELTERILGEPTRTFRYKWLRAVGNEEGHRLPHGPRLHGPRVAAGAHLLGSAGRPARGAGDAGGVRGLELATRFRGAAGDLRPRRRRPRRRQRLVHAAPPARSASASAAAGAPRRCPPGT